MNILHNSHDKIYREPFGAVPIGTTIRISLDVNPFPKNAELHVIIDGTEGEIVPVGTSETIGEVVRYTYEITVDKPGLVWYYFKVDCVSGAVHYYGNNNQMLGGNGATYLFNPPAFQVTVYEPTVIPDWYKNGIIYQIFPDRFSRGEDWEERLAISRRDQNRQGPRRFTHQDWNDKPFYSKNPQGAVTRWGFFGGTLRGIEDKLLYLKNLGVTTIYLNPIFEGASNHKYDTADYKKIDPGFGDEEGFKTLSKKAEKLGMHIMLDGVFSHTGADSIYFNKAGNYPGVGAFNSKDSPYYDWYLFKDYPNDYESWWGVGDLPNVDENNESFREYLFGEDGVIPHWLKLGAKAWRLDVADELPDSFIEALKTSAKKQDENSVLIGEVWEDASYKESYGKRRQYLLGRELDATMNYPFRTAMLGFARGEISSYKLGATIMSLKENYPPEAFYGAMNLLGTHDTERLLTILGVTTVPNTPEEKEHCELSFYEYILAKKRLKMLVTMQFASPGIPSIYYGDETGLQGWTDPYNRGTYPWGNEDKDILEHFNVVTHIRKLYNVLVDGDYKPYCSGDDVYGFWRTNENEAILAVSNRSNETMKVVIDCSDVFDVSPQSVYAIDLFTAENYDTTNGTFTVTIPPISSTLVYFRKHFIESKIPENGVGILCHLSSLPDTDKGLVDSSKKFIDYLASAGQKYWQILPLGPVDENSSPYFSYSVFAGNDNFLSDEEKNMLPDDGFNYYCHEEAFWLEDYALFMCLRNANDGRPWQEWKEEHKNRHDLDRLKEEFSAGIYEVKVKQYNFHKLWLEILNYAHSKGIQIIGELSVAPSDNSVDVWANRHLFILDDDGYPSITAGVEFDFFLPNSNVIGRPVFNIENLKKEDYLWWERRISRAIKSADFIKLDHFRSFANFYVVPRGNDSTNGYRKIGLSKEFFMTMYEKLGPLPIIAEDIGIFDSNVYDLINFTGFAGMNIFELTQHAMQNMSEKKAKKRVFYSSTHDTSTLVSWCNSQGYEGNEALNRADEIIETLYKMPSAATIIPIQDILKLDDKSRMNTPGTIIGNWKFKLNSSEDYEYTAEKLLRLSKKYGRI